MSSEQTIVIKCWNCQKKFTVSVSDLNPDMPVYKDSEPSTTPRESKEKKRLLKTCPYCGEENEIFVPVTWLKR